MSQGYGQFCPIAKATELLGEKWTLLIIRELLMGSARFSELQRGLGMISPTILTKRLETLADGGLVYKRRLEGKRGYEYLPTDACRQLLPILLAIGSWGMQWTKHHLNERDYDVELLMLYLQRSVQTDKLPGGKAVIRFRFDDLQQSKDWWIVAESGNIDVCTVDPSRDIDVYINTSVKTMTDAWMGRTSYGKAAAAGEFEIHGPAVLTANISAWMSDCIFSDLPPPDEILHLSSPARP